MRGGSKAQARPSKKRQGGKQPGAGSSQGGRGTGPVLANSAAIGKAQPTPKASEVQMQQRASVNGTQPQSQSQNVTPNILEQSAMQNASSASSTAKKSSQPATPMESSQGGQADNPQPAAQTPSAQFGSGTTQGVAQGAPKPVMLQVPVSGTVGSTSEASGKQPYVQLHPASAAAEQATPAGAVQPAAQHNPASAIANTASAPTTQQPMQQPEPASAAVDTDPPAAAEQPEALQNPATGAVDNPTAAAGSDVPAQPAGSAAPRTEAAGRGLSASPDEPASAQETSHTRSACLESADQLPPASQIIAEVAKETHTAAEASSNAADVFGYVARDIPARAAPPGARLAAMHAKQPGAAASEATPEGSKGAGHAAGAEAQGVGAETLLGTLPAAGAALEKALVSDVQAAAAKASGISSAVQNAAVEAVNKATGMAASVQSAAVGAVSKATGIATGLANGMASSAHSTAAGAAGMANEVAASSYKSAAGAVNKATGLAKDAVTAGNDAVSAVLDNARETLLSPVHIVHSALVGSNSTAAQPAGTAVEASPQEAGTLERISRGRRDVGKMVADHISHHVTAVSGLAQQAGQQAQQAAQQAAGLPREVMAHGRQHMLGLLQQASRAGQAGLAVAANRAQTAVDLAIEGAALVSVISELGLYMVGKLVYDGQSISQVGDGAFTAVHERMQHGAEQTPP